MQAAPQARLDDRFRGTAISFYFSIKFFNFQSNKFDNF